MQTQPIAPLARRCIRMMPGAILLALLIGAPLRAQTPSEAPAPTDTVTPTETGAPPQTETPAERRPRQHLRLGPDISVFLPTSSKTKDRYGDAWWGIGFGFGSVQQVGLLGTKSGEVFLMHKDSDTGEAYVIPVGLAYRRSLTNSNEARPYVGGAVDLVLADFNSPLDNVGWGLRAGAGVSAIAGTTFGDKGYLEARYMLVTRMEGLDFSGFHVNAGVRF